MSKASSKKSLTILDLMQFKKMGEKISALTAYDASFSQVIDQIGIDLILIGDSLGMIIQGHSTTVPVSLEDVIYHSQCVTRKKKRAFVMADLPFASYHSKEVAIQNASQLMQKGGVQMVKLEGIHRGIIEHLVQHGVPVCGHLGVLPQSIHQIGSYKTQGRHRQEADKLLIDAQKIEQAGASLLILECIPAKLAKKITETLTIPVIGIGAGVDCDGQILVLYDMLGLGEGKFPRFVHNFMKDSDSIRNAIQDYHYAVKSSQFPAVSQSY
jgi:3-methyl-2-oxobutanoate hydroxymethyltransferase